MGAEDPVWRRAALIGALSLLPFYGRAWADGGSWRERLDYVERLSTEGKDAEAAKAAQDVLAEAERSLGPEAPEIGHILARLSRVYEAVEDASRISEMEKRLSAIKSKDSEVWLALGVARHSQEMPLEAVDALKSALALKPNDFDAECELATVDQELGRYEEAVKLFEDAIKQAPHDYRLRMQLAQTYIGLGRSAEAKEALAQAKKIDGKTADAYIDEGYFQLEHGEHAQAKEDFENAIAVDTASPFGYHHMGAYLADSERYPEAEKYFRRALKGLEKNPDTKTDDLLHTINWLGRVLMSQRRPAEAENVLRKCLLVNATSNANYVGCLLQLSQVYAFRDKQMEAEKTLKRATAACEEGPACTCGGMVLTRFSDFYLAWGRKHEAANMADQAEKLCAAYRGPKIEIFLDLAGLYASLGDISKGEALYGRILASGRSVPSSTLSAALLRMADLKMARGRFNEAEGLYRRAIPFFENLDIEQEASAFEGLAAACGKEGKSREATEAGKRARSLRAGVPWRERLDGAERLSKEGKNMEAAEAAQDVLADADKSLEPGASEIGRILARLGGIYEAGGDSARLSEIEKRLSAVKSKDFEVWLALGIALHSQEKPSEAADALKNALAFKPDDLDAERELAMVDQELGRDEDAAQSLEEMIKKNPQDHDLYMQLAQTDTRLGRFAEAKEAFARAGKIGGKTADAYIQEGYFDLDLGESARAKDAFEKAIAVDTASPYGYHHMGAYLGRSGRYLEAEKNFRQALKRLEANPNTSTDDLLHTVNWLGRVLMSQKRPVEAEAVLRKCLLKNAVPSEDYAGCLLQLGQICASENKDAEAERIFKQATSACEGLPACTCRGMALIGFGNFYLAQGRIREAADMAGQAEELCAGYSGPKIAMLLDLAQLYASLGDVSKGEALQRRFHEAVELLRQPIPTEAKASRARP